MEKIDATVTDLDSMNKRIQNTILEYYIYIKDKKNTTNERNK